MKPSAIFKERIADTRQKGQKVDNELAEHNTRNVYREQCIEEGQVSSLNADFQPVRGETSNISLQLFFSADKRLDR